MYTRSTYLFQETLRGIQRGGWMNWAAVSTVTVLLFLFGVSLQANWQLERLVSQFGSQLEVSVFLNPGVETETILPFVQQLPEVAAVEPISQEEAWSELRQELNLPELTVVQAQLGGNPLVDELRIKARRVSEVPVLVDRLEELGGVETVQYWPEVLQQFNQLNQSLHWLGLTLITLLTVAATAVMTTTIRLIITAQRREIEIMQLVGATTAWICLPFLLQGLLFGTVAGGWAWVLLLVSQQSLRRILMQQPDFIQFLASGLQLDAGEWVILPLILFGFGGCIGIFGSLLAVRELV